MNAVIRHNQLAGVPSTKVLNSFFFYITRPKTHVLSLLKLFINLQVVFNGIEDLVLRGCQLRSVRIEIGAIMKISSLFQIQTPGDKKN